MSQSNPTTEELDAILQLQNGAYEVEVPDLEEIEERVKEIVQGVAMTVDYTERLHAAVQEIMAIMIPRPTP